IGLFEPSASDPPPLSSRPSGIPLDWQSAYDFAFAISFPFLVELQLYSHSVLYCNYKIDASGRSILMGLLAGAARPLTAPQLIRLAAPLGLCASNLKSHLTRLVADGALRRKGPSRRAVYLPSRFQA